MLSLRRNRNFPLRIALLGLLLVLLQPNAVGNGLHGLPDKVEFVDSLLEAAPASGGRVQAALQQIDKGLAVDFAHAGNVESDAIDFEFGLVLVVIELGFVQSDQFQHHHRNGEHVRFVDVVSSLVVVVGDVFQLFGGEDVVFDLRSFAESFEETAVAVVLLDFQQVDLDVPLGTEVDGFGAVLANGNAVFLEVAAHVQQTAHDVDEFTFGEVAVLQLLLLNRFLQREVVVVAEGVYLFVLDADLVFYNYHGGTLDELAVVDLRDVLMVHVLDLVHEAHVLPHTFVVFYKVLLKIHNVFVGRLLRTQDVHCPEISVLGTLDEDESAGVFGLQLGGL